MHGSRGTRVLIVEDEVLISMLVQEELEAAGYTIVGSFTTCLGASRWLQHDTPDYAILDFGLSDGPCTDVAVELDRRGVPFLLLTGDMVEILPEVFRRVPQILKPSSLANLAAELERLR